jgi:SAM-dependent methyltransferase
MGKLRERDMKELSFEHHDYIMDAYNGEMGKDFMHKTQARIHWICEQVAGSLVLDVGCSQGIVPLLLGRKGKAVVGIDGDLQSINFARNVIGNEPSSVQQKIILIEADFIKHEFNEEAFDTILMTEILEHLVDPSAFVEKASHLLMPGGRLVVTVPFGINDFIGHKQTFYFAGIERLLAEKFEVGAVKFFGQWIGFVATLRTKKRAWSEEYPQILIQELEENFFKIERELRNSLATVKKSAEERVGDLTERLSIAEGHLIPITDSYNISAWTRPVYRYSNVKDVLSNFVIKDGILSISLNNDLSLDICFEGLDLLAAEEKDRVLLIGIGGAVSSRAGKKAPFFSGMGIAKSLGLPICSFSDPSLALDGELPLAWYAGDQSNPDVPILLAQVLDFVSKSLKAKLIVFGGSGGGYASLMLSSLLTVPSKILVWNPQTEICEYNSKFVQQYMDAGFTQFDAIKSSMDRGTTAYFHEVFDSYNIIHNVRDRLLSDSVEVLYMQNQLDLHIKSHAEPYFANKKMQRSGDVIFSSPDKKINAYFGCWGEGHAVPPKESIESILSMLASGKSSFDVSVELEAGINGLEQCPAHFLWCAVDASYEMNLQAIRTGSKIEVVCLLGTSFNDPKLKYAFYLLVNGVRIQSRWYEPLNQIAFELPETDGKLEVIAFCRDQFSGQIMKRVNVFSAT